MPRSDGSAASRAVLLHVLYFLSGALALVYEVLWMRRFTTLFGATGLATAATLAAVFAGLGAGSVVLGRRCAGWRRPLRAFGLLEAGIGMGALLTVPILMLSDPVHRLLTGAGYSHSIVIVSAEFVLAAGAVFLPTFLMGGSLPVLGQVLAAGHPHLGSCAGRLTAVNTAGAALGALVVPWLLLPALGATGAGLVAVVGSVLIGACALALDRGVRQPEGAVVGRLSASQPQLRPELPTRDRRWLAGAALASGALTLCVEALWTRMLAQVHESSLHAFAVVLAVFLVGLALGAGAGSALLARGVGPRRLAGLAWLGAGVFVLASPHLFVRVTHGLARLPRDVAWGEHLASIAWIALACMLPATVLAGMVLPALMEVAGRVDAGRPGPALGPLLGWNLAGCVAGPVIATFALVPFAGLWGSLTVAGGLMGAAGAWLLPPARAGGRAGRPLAVFGLVLALIALQPGDLPRVELGPSERLIALQEGALGTVAVVQDGASRRMKLDNSYTIGGTLSTGDERFQAHLPLLLHPHPRRVALLGLGTGITAGAALVHPVERIVAVELLPEVARMAREHFAQANAGLFADPRVVVIAADARRWLASRSGTEDVIIGDLFVPWRRGEAALFTLEQFEAARSALAPGGVFCQWVPAFQLSEQDFLALVRTFLVAFPSATLWRGDFHAHEPALALVGCSAARPLFAAEVDARVRELAGEPDPSNPYLVDPAGAWLHLVGALDAQDPLLASARLNRDDRPWIELTSPLIRGGGAGPGGARLTGSRLTPILEHVRQHPLGGTPLAGLDARHRAWRDAGADLWHASLLADAGRMEEADALGFATLARLPGSIQVAVTGGVLAAPGSP